MMQSRTRHLLGLDLLRATAIVMVLCAHVPKSNEGLATRILNFGWTGVDLFFVLSGFLIGGQVFQALATHDEGWLKQFYLRRLLRTLPPYYAVVAIYCALAGLLSIPFPTSNYAIFTQNFAPLTTFTASWSLCVEEQFYLLFPCVALLFLRIRNLRTLRYGLLLFLISEAVLRLAIWLHFRPDLLVEPHALTIYMRQLYYPTYTRLDGIALGVGLAAWKCFFPKRWSLLMQHGNFLIAGAGAFMAVAILALWKHYSLACSTLGFTFLNLSFCCLTAAAVSHGSLLAKLGIPGVRYLATISYSVYLTHSLAIEITTLALVRWYVPRHSGIPTVLTVVAILLSSLLLYFCVERPALAFRDRVFRRPSKRLPVVANSGEPGVSIARTNEPLGQMPLRSEGIGN